MKKEEKLYEFLHGSIQQKLQEALFNAVQKMGVDLALNKIHLERPADSLHGDWSSNIAMTLAKELGKGPKEVASEIVKVIDDTLPNPPSREGVSKVEIAGAGFVNFYLSDDFHKRIINEIIQKDGDFGKSDYGKGKTVVIDYSSPNIAKRFSIGHLRSTIIGQALYNLYKFIGYKAIGDNHLGDWGTQFGVLIYMIESKGLDPNSLTVEGWEKIYVEFHKELDEDPTLKDKARDAFARLERDDPKARNIWQIAHKTSMAEYQKIYDLLGVSIDYAYGESFYEDKMKEGINLAIERGVAEQSEGALAVNFDPKYKLPSNLLLKSNETTTYLTRDLAVMLFRKKTWDPDLQIFEVGADQKLYFKQVFALAEMLGIFQLDQLKHVAHGMIRLKEGKMSTRKGKTIKLEEVLNEAIEKAKTLGDVDDDIAKKVGIGAIKWNDLKRDPTQDIIFDWDEVLNMKGNSGPYIQYTFTRAKSILNQAGNLGSEFDPTTTLMTEVEMDVVKQLTMFPDVILSSATNYSPNLLCSYLYSLAQKFNKFYTECSVLSATKEEDRNARLALTKAVVQVLQNGLKLLGIETVERM